MKQYTKNGEIKPRNKIVLYVTKVINGVEKSFQVINPTHELLLENGWTEFIAPEKTSEQILIEAKRAKVVEIKNYDSSSAINEFYLNGESLWFDKSTRGDLKFRFEAEEKIGKENTILWYNNKEYLLSLSDAVQLLYALEIYAAECYDNTRRHLNNVSNIQNIDDLAAYDYTAGYPEKLHFEYN